MNKSKLYHITDSSFKLPLYVDRQHKVVTVNAEDIPTIKWPDGSWCLPANIYMLELFNRGLSRKNRGGTLLTYAANISHLLRYTFNNKIDLANLSDNEFSLFIKMLQGERRVLQPDVFTRDTNSVISIGRNCLDFLSCVGRLYQDDNFIGPKGQIRAVQKELTLKSDGNKIGRGKLLRKYWHHRSFPTPDPKNKRLPISSKTVERLREVVQSMSGTIFLRKRRYVMIKLLEITGGRRSEVAAITCNSVREASKMDDPLLKLVTVKKRGGEDEFRYIPISRHDIEFLLEYIDKNRRRIIRSTCGQKNDDDFLLISETSGKKLRPNTITQEISSLSKSAGISEKSCPHMFRHRFITKLFVALIEQYKFENTETFRKALLETEKIKQIVQQWTGHKSLTSLDVYINLAFDEVTNFKTAYNIVKTKLVLNSFQGTLKQYQTELKDGYSPTEIASKLDKLISALEEDLDKCQL